MIMVHGDNKGLVLPPKVAFTQIVIIPIHFAADEESKRDAVTKSAGLINDSLKNAGVLVTLDDRENYTPGNKYNFWELRGVPIRLELGPKDLDKNQCILVRRDTGVKTTVSLDGIGNTVIQLLDSIQNDMLARAKQNMRE